MEVAPGATAAVRNGGVSLPSASSSQPARKEWRVVSEQSVRNSSNEELERSKLGHTDERLIYEVQHGREPLDVDFCSITIDGGLDNDILQQRLHNVVKQREELQQMEIDIRAQVVARSEILRLQNTFDAQLKEHANATAKYQEQLRENEEKVRELESKIDEKERELHAIRLDNEAQAWAKEDLLREQSKELQSYRRERDNSEAERVQHIKQIHDLRELLQEKERQFMEMQEQHRIAQETVLYKDEQIREAQAWIARAQELDTIQSTTNHSLQAELQERTELYNQLWLGCQRQFGEIEQLHLHIQKLQLELGDAREKSGIHLDESHVSHTSSNGVSQLGQANGSQLELNDNNSPKPDTGNVQNGTSEISGGNTTTQTDHVHGVAFAPSIFGMPTYLPPALHPFVMHQQGVPHPSHAAQSHFHQLPEMSSIQNWQNQQVPPDGEQAPTQNQYSDQTGENLLRMNSHFDFDASAKGQVIHTNYADTSTMKDSDTFVPSPNGEGQVHDSIDESHKSQSHQNLQQISSQFREALRLDAIEHGNDTKEKKTNLVSNHGLDTFFINSSPSEASSSAINFSESSDAASGVSLTSTFVSTGQKSSIVGKPGESYLLDERTLLASIARVIGPGGRIRISSTLPNRLGKMLAPLHWHDYKKKYGKLDDFVASHADLFLIEGDYIQLREGAQKIIVATAAVAKVAAAAAAAVPSSYSSSLPSVAVTPMAQSHCLKKAPSLDSSSASADQASFIEPRSSNALNHPSSFLEIQSQNFNGNSFQVSGGVSNVQMLSKPKHNEEFIGSETSPSRSALLSMGNGMNSNRTSFSQSKGIPHGRPGVTIVGKQQSRSAAASSTPRR